MRAALWLLLAFAVAVGVALLMHFNHGNVAILWPPYRIEVSANFAIVLLAVAFVVLHLLVLAARRALALPSRVRDFRVRRRREQAHTALRDSVLAFFEGRLGRVERLARAAQADPATAAPAALIAARCAQRMREQERRDRWLADARSDAKASTALLMTEAELALEDHRPLDAIALIEQLHAGGARHVVALRTALRAYEQAERWADVMHTLRLLEKRDALHPVALRRTRERAFDALVAARGDDLPGLREMWRSLKAEERRLPELAARMATALIAAGAPEDARKSLEQALDAGYDPRPVPVYARLSTVPLRERLERLEGWRQRYGDEADLLLGLGQACAGEGLWGKAEDYLLKALEREPSVAVHAALGDLYACLERPDDANRHFRDAARRALARPTPNAESAVNRVEGPRS